VLKNYAETLEYLYKSLPMFQRIGAAAYKPDLSNTIALLKVLDNPQELFKSIHVAGTNGKGSTSHMLAAILIASGYSTGLYTSPHLKEFTERIRINGAELDKDFVVEFVNRIRPAIEEIKPSFFEVTVAMAFEYFGKVEVAVIEVGLGGRLDSTNVITPDLSVITNISYDHKDLLGDTLEKIAGEKAGIIKSGVPVVVSERQQEVENVFIAKAEQCHAELEFASDHVALKQVGNSIDVIFDSKTWMKNLNPELRGNYQRKNIPGVIAAVIKLRELGYVIPDHAVRHGIEQVVMLTGLKGRWQTINTRPLTICDTGHNKAGIAEVLQQIRETPHRHLHFVFGVVKDKDVSDILRMLPKDASYYFCQAKIPRAMDAAALQELAGRERLNGQVIPDVNEAVKAATRAAAPDDLVFIGGSTFIVAEVDGL
jgi:dihydrofolate synthase/folylpolyglutamate synthase